jgi:integrase
MAKVLGHKDPAMTLRRYSHVLDEIEDTAAQRMDGYAF